jgi:D-alanyl-D-alanine carboxypeptidase
MMIDRDSTFVRAISIVDAVARRRLVAIAVALAVVASAPVALGETPQRAADAKLARALAQLVSMPGGPPGAIAVVQRGNTVKVFSAGVAELGAKRRPSLNDHVRLASMSKAYSGAAALSLVSQGRLSLDDTIAQRLPRLPTAWGNVTLRQLLNHTSGLPDFVSSEAAQQAIAASLTVPPRPDQLLDFVKDEPLKFAPGSKYTYSNSDNVAVGLMVAAVSGTTYEQQLQEQIFGPLGLTRTSLPVGPVLPTPFVRGYDVPASGPPEDLSEVMAAGWAWASGGMVSTPTEVNRFIRGYVGGKLFDTPAQNAQREVIPGGGSEPPGPGVNAAGLGIFRYTTRCGTVFGHTGNVFGYTDFMSASPDGTHSAVVTASEQLRPNLNGKVFAAFRRAEVLAVCAALAGR